MADSLDDFFAKKDKKRNKDKGKSALSAEVLVRELEEGSRPVEPVTRKDTKTSATMELLGLDADDADWRDFEDVEKRDYSGLKVKEMSLQDQNEEEQRRLISEQTEQVPESTPWRIKSEGDAAATAAGPTAAAATASASAASTTDAAAPTNAKSGTSANQDLADKLPTSTSESAATTADSKIAENQKVDPSKTGDKESAKPKKYIPPGGRGENGEMRILEPVRLSRTRTAGSHFGSSIPNIQDEQAFPSLG